MKLISATKNFRFYFDHVYKDPPYAQRYLSNWAHAIRPKIKHLCDTRDRNTLWWMVSVHPVLDHKSTVQNWCARRTRMAFRQELKERGYDAEGRRLENRAQASATPSEHHGNLLGNVKIQTKRQCLDADYAVIRAEMKTLVDALIFHQKEFSRQQEEATKRSQLQRLKNLYSSESRRLGSKKKEISSC
ncbi:hypothetical protein BJX61DRAFT_514747 [Aspergillus egyptiacus]|nr:hypothetical protein BJX61DRAFT_514747 [Aspergillus egyptiacus]